MTSPVYPAYVDAESVRKAVLDYLTYVDNEWKQGNRKHVEDRLLVFKGGRLVTFENPYLAKHKHFGQAAGYVCRAAARVRHTKKINMDWAAVYGSVMGHALSWELSGCSGEILCPTTLGKLRDVLDRDFYTREVTLAEMREAFEDAPVVSLARWRKRSTEWKDMGLAVAWIGKWRTYTTLLSKVDG